MEEKETTNRKTGMTPEVVEGVRGQEVHRIAKCELMVVEYTDGFGKREVRVGFAFGKEVRFLDEKLLSKPAQNWLAEGIFKKLAADGS